MKKFLISASILSADFCHLGDEINDVLSAGSDMIHFDVMDNHYVPNLSLGPMVLKSIRNFGITAPIDVHLMVSPVVDSLILDFAVAGASYIIIHPETTDNLERTLRLIKKCGCFAGIALHPSISINILKYVVNYIDLVLVMTVNPGFGGQKFLNDMLNKIKYIHKFIYKYKQDIILAVDGGINITNFISVIESGVDILVIGSALFNSNNYFKTIKTFKNYM